MGRLAESIIEADFICIGMIPNPMADDVCAA
jgi:hypothetical protein